MYKIDLNKAPRAKALLQAQVGEKTDLSQFAVFELRANDTLPITKAGGMLLNSRMTPTYLAQMSQVINSGNYVPVIELHDQHSKLPVGRILDAKVYDNEADFNQKDLHVLIYLQADNKEVPKIDSGIVNEVSTGTSPSSVKCSACEFDFFASKENRRKLWEGKDYTPLCENGHQWGMNGNHLRLDGMKDFREISVVTRGAAGNAQVIKAENARLAAETSEINLSANFCTDILLSTVKDANFAEFEKPVGLDIQTPIQNTGAIMGDINLAQDKYDQLIKDQGKIEQLNADLTAARTDLATAVTAKDAALADKVTAETAKTTAETNLSDMTTKHDALQVALTAAEAKIAVYAAGGKPDGDGVATPAGAPEEGANLQAQPLLDDSFYKAAKK